MIITRGKIQITLYKATLKCGKEEIIEGKEEERGRRWGRKRKKGDGKGGRKRKKGERK